LQAFDLEKKAENFIKIWLYQRDENLISAVAPKMYATRFYKFMKEKVLINQKTNLEYTNRNSVMPSFIYKEPKSRFEVSKN